MPMTEVLVVGAGPVGLALAADLRARGVDVALVERRTEAGAGTRAIGIHSPALALLEASGATDGILDRAVRIARGEARADGRLLAAIRFDRLRARHPYVAALPQSDTIEVLTALAPPVRRGVTVESLRAEADGVRVGVAGADDLRAKVVVVASGWAGRSLVYRDGAVRTHHYPDRYVMADVTAPAARSRACTSSATAWSSRSPSPTGAGGSWPGPAGTRFRMPRPSCTTRWHDARGSRSTRPGRRASACDARWLLHCVAAA